MNVFISWSGDLSREVGTILANWFERYVQGANIWISTNNIGAGTMWFQQIKSTLDQTSIGIICLTRSNHNNPWILFEAGAIAKGTESNRVCPLLIDMATSELQAPLSQFNATKLEKVAFKKLVQTINSGLQKQIPEAILDDIIETTWDPLVAAIDGAIADSESAPAPTKRSVEDYVIEMSRLVNESTQAIARQQNEIAALTDLMNKVARRAVPEMALAEYFAMAENASLASALKRPVNTLGELYSERQKAVAGGLLTTNFNPETKGNNG